MQTARGTGTSVGQPFDDRIAFDAYFLIEVFWGYAGESRFHIPVHRRPHGDQKIFNLIEKFLTSRFGDIQEPDSGSGK